MNRITLEAHELPINSVTLFSDRAEIQHNIVLELGPGDHEITLQNFTDPSIIFESLSVLVPGQEHVLLSTVVHEQKAVFLKEKKDQIEEEILALEKSIDEHEDAREMLKAQKRFIRDYGVELTQYSRNVLPTIEELTQFLDFYVAKTSSLAQEDLLEKNKIRVLRKSLTSKLETVFAQARQNSRDVYYLSNETALSKACEQKVHNVVINLLHNVETRKLVTLTVRYVTKAATWKPSYRIEVDSKTKKAELHFYAQVHQWSAVHWCNVKLQLSTADASLSVVPPRMTPLYLGFERESVKSKDSSGQFATASLMSLNINDESNTVNEDQEEKEEFLSEELDGLFEEKEDETSTSNSSASSVYSFVR